jgi:outer membrane immunogenic protein
MRRFSVALCAALVMFLGLSEASLAQDSKAGGPSWTGFYLGGGVGFRTANVNASTVSVTQTTSLGATDGCISYDCNNQTLNSNSFRFNPYVGYNWQFAPQWLVGIEGDYGFASKTTTLNNMSYPGFDDSDFFAFPGQVNSFAVKTGWDASIRGRAGFLPTRDVLVYATGGPAWQHIESTATCSNDPVGPFSCQPPGNGSPNYAITDTANKLGYTVGGGLETLLSGHWLLRGEYRYANFGTVTHTDSVCDAMFGCGSVQQTAVYKLQLSTQTATLGLAYKF